ncbi:PP2C family protein-serine/threonine phosphatase [Bryobacter aggregatus]|uniref:PP2C family protein-serine/threonine phosphatase n=1 Tax=Bryobacter aggregatus TaxID=360054 RepID=UPI00068A7659|nr:PP2C family protein-serine/threonine phosphatase [Bryobacter aggregatus]
MQNLADRPTPTLDGFDEEQQQWNVLTYLRRQPRSVHALILLALIVLIAGLDFTVDRDLSLFALYLIPALYGVWFLGRRWGYISCLVSAVIWLVDAWQGLPALRSVLIPYWNLAERLIVLLVVVSIVNAMRQALQDEHEAKERDVRREFELAREVQGRLLPSEAPDYPRVEFGFFYQAARKVGGDYYDFIPITPDRLAIAVGDVSGKGLSSALLMASLQSLVRTNLVARQGELTRFVTELNHSLYKMTASSRYATLFFAILDVSDLTLRYVNAGQNSPFLFRHGDTPAIVESLTTGGLPIGIVAESHYQSGGMQLHDGDVLIAYTDGVVEALNAKQEEFGEARLKEIVQASLSTSAAEICRQIASQLNAFVADTAQFDDITLVVMKIQAKREPLAA